MHAASRFYDAKRTDHPDIDDRLGKVISLIAKRRPASLLDLGCGRGTLLAALRPHLSTEGYVGTEISESSCALARENGVSVVAHDLASPLPFGDSTFETVVFGELIEHLFDPDFALDEIHRVLEPGGMLIVTTPNLACWLNRLLVPLGIQPIFTEISSRKKYGRRFGFLGQNSTEMEGHIRVMTTAALVEMVRDRGYRVLKVIGARFNAFENNAIARRIDALLCSVPALASGAIVVAEKI